MKLDTFLATTLTNQNVPHSKTSGMSRARSAVNSTYLAIKNISKYSTVIKASFCNFYPSKINAFDESLGSAEQAYQITQAFTGNLIAAEKRKAKTAQNDRQDHVRVTTVASCGRIYDKVDHR